MDVNEWERRLKSGIKSGDHYSFKQLYQRYYPGLCRIALRYTGKSEIAEEIVQETFLKIWHKRKEIQIEGSIHSYLFISVRNGALNYLRQLMAERKFNAEAARHLQSTLNYLYLTQEDGSSILISEELEKGFNDALGSLPPKCRQIFLMSRQKEMKHHEIATELGISQNTVQRQISITIEKLVKMLLPLTRLKK